MTAIDDAVQRAFGQAARVVSVTPSIYATSHPIADVVVDLGDDGTVLLLLKEVRSLLDGAAAAKPSFLRDPMRETALYRELLSRVDVGAPRLIDAGDGWLLLEKVDGVELYQVGDGAVWREVARRLAKAHADLADAEQQAVDAGDTWPSHVIRYNRAFIGAWAQRAEAALIETPARPWATALRQRYDDVSDRLLALPQTVVHGELYASNVLVTEIAMPVRRVCPIDWEMAALGPGLLDLAALVAGGWAESDRRWIAAGYLDAAPGVGEDDLSLCRLHVAVQWIGWAAGWKPPSEHTHHWLEEAQALSEALDLV